MSETAIDILKEAIQWLRDVEEDRARMAEESLPDAPWMDKALTLIEINPQEVSISRQNLDWLTGQVRDYKQLKADAEIDIGYLQECVYNLQNLGDPMKLVMKLVSGKIDMKALGLDTDRLSAIAQKYAPAKFEELKERDAKKKK